MRRRFIKLSVSCIFFFSLCAHPFYAAGIEQKDPEMAQVDRLIAAKDYPAAIRFLTERIRLKDEKFDKYQDRLRQILLRMNNYTVVANILLDLLEKDPEGDLEQILALSRQLSEMNSVRDENTANYFDNIEVVARFTVNRRILERILREGRAFLDQGQFLAALRKYQTGLDLYQAEMFRDNFGDDINSQTRSNFLEINNIISTISPLIDTFLAARTNVMSQDATDNNRAAFAAAYNRLVPQLDRLVQAKQIMTNASDFWRSENNKNESAGNKKEGRYFFSMAPVFINGRSDQQIREGMLGALDGIWRTAIDPIENSFEKISEDIYNNALSNAENGNYSASHSEIERAISFNATPLALIAKWDSFTRPDKMPDQNLLGQNVDAARLDEFLRYTSMDASLEYLDTADTLGSRFATELNRRDSSDTLKAWQAGSLSSTDALTRERQIRTVYKEIAVDITKALTSNDADAKKYSALGTAKDSSRYFGNSRRVLENIGLGIYTAELNSAERIYTIANAALSKKADELEKDFDDANRFASGTPFKLASGEQITAKYPREALGIWEKDQADLDKAIADVSDLLKEHQNELSSFANNGDIVKLRTEAGAISNRLNAMRRKESTSITLARASLTTADNQKKQAEQFIQNARRELDKNNFDAAHEQVERAATAFNSSLSYQEDEVVRRALDDRLVPLNAEITRAQYVYTEREVENLINSARNTYFDGNFDAAEERLVRAEERWSTISTGGNEELNYWLTIVRGALSLRSGRYIPITAPLYPEMSQLLNNAQKNYNEGVRLLNSNRREDGLKWFEMAKAKTQEVRLMFPVNQDAGILELKIDQVIDPGSFEKSFHQRFATAVAGASRGSVQSYADLQNLAAINPNYSGMRAALYQAEIDIGIRAPPPNTVALRRSDELTAAATRLFRANIRSQYQVVLDNVNDALRLNPNNLAATQLKEQVQTAMGTNAVSAEDTYTETEYLRAVRELQNGNKVLAMSIVERLLQIPKNQTSPRIIELRRRIETSL